MSAGGAIGDLLLVYKKVQRLAGLTTRVSELLEALERMEAAEAIEATEAIEAAEALALADGGGGGACEGGAREGGAEERATYDDMAKVDKMRCQREQKQHEESRESRESLDLQCVSVRTPDGRCLVKDLSLRLPRKRSLLVTGPNGAGKSSLVRALKGLWPLESGTVRLPTCEGFHSLCFVPQNAYMMMGTLRDQVLDAPPPSASPPTAPSLSRASAFSPHPSPLPTPTRFLSFTPTRPHQSHRPSHHRPSHHHPSHHHHLGPHPNPRPQP